MNFEQRLQNKVIEIKTNSKGTSEFNQKPEKKQTKKQKLIDDFIEVKKEYLKKFNKDEYRDFIKELETNLDDVRKKINKMKISEIQELLAKMIEKIMNEPSGPETHAGGEQLYNLVLILTKGLEEFSEVGDQYLSSKNPDKTKTVALTGLTKDYQSNEPLLKPILAEIYAEHKSDIDQYLSPWTKLSIIYAQMILSRVAQNNQKEKE